MGHLWYIPREPGPHSQKCSRVYSIHLLNHSNQERQTSIILFSFYYPNHTPKMNRINAPRKSNSTYFLFEITNYHTYKQKGWNRCATRIQGTISVPYPNVGQWSIVGFTFEQLWCCILRTTTVRGQKFVRFEEVAKSEI